MKIYDTVSQMRLVFIDRPAESPRADLFKCTLYWQDDSTLLIAWADVIRVARIRDRPRPNTTPAAKQPPLLVEITAVFQLDCMITGIVPHPIPYSSHVVGPSPSMTQPLGSNIAAPVKTLTAFLVLAYTPPDTSFFNGNEVASSHAEQARKAAERPELRIINRAGEELSTDALSISGYEKWGCNDYVLVEVPSTTPGVANSYVVMSPKDVVVVRPRDWRDHVAWLVERRRYEEALEVLEKSSETSQEEDNAVHAVEIGQKYIEHLVSEGKILQTFHIVFQFLSLSVHRRFREGRSVVSQGLRAGR